MLLEVLKVPQNLNLLFSTLILLLGLAVYWYHPGIFHAHTFVERSFEFWVLKWMGFVITWGLVTTSTDLRFALAATDLNSVCGIGMVVALWRGDEYDERHTLTNMVFLFGLLFAWNFSSQVLLGPGKAWIYPSMTMSVIVISAMAVAVVARYGTPGIAFAVISLIYLLLQLPTYQVIYITTSHPDAELVKWLAFAKVLYATVFYGVFSSPLKHPRPIQLPKLPIPAITEEKLHGIMTYLGGIILGGILTEVMLWVGKHLWLLLAGSGSSA
jgi:hypothetical protein